MKTRLVVLTLIVAVTLSVDSVQFENTTIASANTTRHGKFFPIFSIIRFPNNACTGTGSFIGTCYTRRECKNLGGLSTGSCASKRGVCCVLQQSCGSSTNVNNTYFVNTAYPSPTTTGGSCSISVTRDNPDICQLRIDFLDLSLAQPNGDGNCVRDSLTVSGGGSSVPTICGDNNGQHVITNFDGNSAISITVSTSSAITLRRRWNLKLTQVECSSPFHAPSGCLMYYTGTTGTVRSFNYGSTANPALSSQGEIGTREMTNLNYGVCIRVEANFCNIQWASQSADRFSFTVSGDVTGLGDGVGTVAAAQRGAVCTTDFVGIMNPTTTAGVALNVDRFCGTGFQTVLSTAKPYVLTVVTNDNEAPPPPALLDTANRGFALTFTQQLC